MLWKFGLAHTGVQLQAWCPRFQIAQKKSCCFVVNRSMLLPSSCLGSHLKRKASNTAVQLSNPLLLHYQPSLQSPCCTQYAIQNENTPCLSFLPFTALSHSACLQTNLLPIANNLSCPLRSTRLNHTTRPYSLQHLAPFHLAFPLCTPACFQGHAF
jgi:hypothetical protein